MVGRKLRGRMDYSRPATSKPPRRRLPKQAAPEPPDRTIEAAARAAVRKALDPKR